MRRLAQILLGVVVVGCGFFAIVMLVGSSGTYLLIPALLLLVTATAGLILRQLLKTDSSTWPDREGPISKAAAPRTGGGRS